MRQILSPTADLCSSALAAAACVAWAELGGRGQGKQRGLRVTDLDLKPWLLNLLI